LHSLSFDLNGYRTLCCVFTAFVPLLIASSLQTTGLPITVCGLDGVTYNTTQGALSTSTIQDSCYVACVCSQLFSFLHYFVSAPVAYLHV
jgi:hypothetical protein